MIVVNGTRISMSALDFGLPIPFRLTFPHGDPEPTDMIRFTISGGTEPIVQEFSGASVIAAAGSLIVSLSAAESGRLAPGVYRWTLSLHRGGTLLSTLCGPHFFEVRR